MTFDLVSTSVFLGFTLVDVFLVYDIHKRVFQKEKEKDEEQRVEEERKPRSYR